MSYFHNKNELHLILDRLYYHKFVQMLLHQEVASDAKSDNPRNKYYELPMHYSFGLLGLSSWLLISGIYSVSAAFAETLPEGYDISTYLVFTQAASNICPAILQFCFQFKDDCVVKRFVLGNLCCGIVVSICLAFFWDHIIAGYSISLYILTFISGCLNSATNITHYSFVARFEYKCTLYYSAGLGLGSTAVGLLSLLQNQGIFSVREYFLSFLSIYMCSLYGI